MIQRAIRRFGAIVGLGALVVAASVVSASPASATASGSELITASSLSISAPGVSGPIVLGQLNHVVYGDGLYVSEEKASFSYIGTTLAQYTAFKVCNWRIDFVNQVAATGSRIVKYRSPTYSGCYKSGSARKVWSPDTLYARGASCAVLFQNGVKVVEQCHNVY